MSLLELLDGVASREVSASIMNTNNARTEAVVNNLEDENFAADFPVVTATSVAGLGTARDGKRGLLRCGTTPFEFVSVIYDATLAKWVSKPVMILHQHDDPGADEALPLLLSIAPHVLIPNFKSIYDAGLRPQVQGGGRIGGEAADITVLLSEVADADTADSQIAAATLFESPSSEAPTSTRHFATGWTDMTINSAPIDAHAIAEIFVFVWEFDDILLQNFTAWLRYVSA